MPVIKPVKGINPKLGNNCYLAENATVVGEVTMGIIVAFGSMLW